MGRRLGLVGAALICGASVATAVPSLSIGSGSEIYLTGSATVRYDDNVGLAETNAESDSIFVLTPGISLEYSEGPSKGGLVLAEQFIRYADATNYNSDLFSAVGNFRHDGPKTEFVAAASYRELSQNSVRIRSADQKEERSLTALNLAAISSLTAKTRLGVGADYQETDYENAGFIDSAVWSVPVDLYLARTEKTDLSVGYRYRQNSLSGSARDSTDHFLNVGVRGEYTPKLGGQLRVGFNRRNIDGSQSEDQLGVGASATYVASAKSTIELNVSNDFSNSATGDSQRSLVISATGRFDLSPDLTASLALSYDSSKYLTSGRRDDFWVAEASVQYALGEHWAMQGEYVYRQNDSNAGGLSFENNLLSFGVSCRY